MTQDSTLDALSTQEHKYEIITNINRRKILVINDVVDVDRNPELGFEDFDAIFINVINGLNDYNMLALRLASPLLSEKCRFKPCFVTQRLMGWLGGAEIIIDGYAASPTDRAMAQKIDEIYASMRRLNFLLGTEPVVTHAEEMFRLVRYAISRGRFTFSSEPVRGLSSGYMALYNYTMWYTGQERIAALEREFFHSEMLRLGYIRRGRFMDKIHECPHCGSSHLFFFESCPRCSSSDIRQQSVIHHFRCANVSPEATYEWDGELRCPKCQQRLRHIGVDYDKPSAIYTCNQCEESFMYPDMRVLCSSCQRTLATDDLVPRDVIEYELTPDGIHAFANNEVNHTISQAGFYGYTSTRNFMDYVRQFSTSAVNSGEILVVVRFYVFDPLADEMAGVDVRPPVVQAMRRFFNYKSSMWGNNYYFMSRIREGEIARIQGQMEYELTAELNDYKSHHPGFVFDHIETYVYYPNMEPNQFIARLEEHHRG